MNKEEHMILKVTQQDSDANNTNDYFDAMRQKNYEASFDGVKNFIEKTRTSFITAGIKSRCANGNGCLLFYFPVLVVLACTKTERTEPVGQYRFVQRAGR
jgi:hypothetical protein